MRRALPSRPLRTLFAVVSLALCGPPLFAMRPKAAETFSVFAAQSLKGALTEAGRIWEEKNPGFTPEFTFGGSGNLARMIASGADCDVFISADEATMDGMDALAGGKGPVADHSTRTDLLRNSLCLVSADDCPGMDFAKLAARLRAGDVVLAMGGAGVPAGDYMRKVLGHFGISEPSVSDLLVYGNDVAAVAKTVAEKAADFGAVYATDAARYGLAVLDTATDAMTGGAVLYPAAVMKNSRNREVSLSFVSFLRDDADARAVFGKFGFDAP